MCIYNQMVINPKYKKNKKNGGTVPPLSDERVKWIPIGCGNCMECRKEKQREWMVRLLEDIKTNEGGKFVTLTLSNQSIAELVETEVKRTDEDGRIQKIKIIDLKGYDKDNAIAAKAIERFRERWRKEYKVSIRHWLVTELGHKGTENVHLHGIIWPKLEGKWEENYKIVERIWKYGFIWKGYWKRGELENYVNEKTVVYSTKYLSKIDRRHKEYKGKIYTSGGIGANYIGTKASRKNMEELSEVYKTSTGHEIKLPIYWRNKVFTENTREKLWIDKLDEEVRWVDGQRIEIREGEEQYKKAIKQARIKNLELGYGGRANENRKKYEEQRREIMIATRIKAGNRMKSRDEQKE